MFVCCQQHFFCLTSIPTALYRTEIINASENLSWCSCFHTRGSGFNFINYISQASDKEDAPSSSTQLTAQLLWMNPELHQSCRYIFIKMPVIMYKTRFRCLNYALGLELQRWGQENRAAAQSKGSCKMRRNSFTWDTLRTASPAVTRPWTNERAATSVRVTFIFIWRGVSPKGRSVSICLDTHSR